MGGVARGPWACPACVEHTKARGVRDVGLDRNLMSTVVRREAPQWWRPEEACRCVRVSCWLSWKRGHLWVEDDCGERRVPAMFEREDIVKFTAQ